MAMSLDCRPFDSQILNSVTPLVGNSAHWWVFMGPHSPPIISPFSKNGIKTLTASVLHLCIHPWAFRFWHHIVPAWFSFDIPSRHIHHPSQHMTYISARDGIFHSNSATRIHHSDVNRLLSILCFGYVRIQLAFLKQFVKLADSDKLILFPLFQLSSDSLPVIPPALSVSSGERDRNFQSLPAMMQQSNLLWWWLN